MTEPIQMHLVSMSNYSKAATTDISDEWGKKI